jgi:protein TonB
MGVVAAMHAALLLVLARSFGITPPALFEPDPIQIDDSPPVMPDDPPPPPANPTFEQTAVNLVLPVDPVPMDNSVDPPPDLTIGTGPDIIQGPGSAVAAPVIQGARLDPRRPLSLPVYSASYIRAGIEGSVDVEVFVQPDGRVGDARILRSSGYEQMDRSTLDEAKRRWRLLPATRDGAPFAQWYRLRVKFELKDN